MTNDTRDCVQAALDQTFRDSGDMVTRWVLCAEVIGQDGERGMWSMAAADLKGWDVLGLLTYALHREQAATVRDEMEGE